LDKFQGICQQPIPVTIVIGIIIILGYFVGRSLQRFRLPVIIGYMITGVVLGPSFLNIASCGMQTQLPFVTRLTLACVALKIGLELNLRDLKEFGFSIILIILSESFFAFLLVFGALYAFTGNLPLSLMFGAVAPASAPAGTVAVIQEYHAKGKLTKALYAVVGFDDGLAIIIFGFVITFVRYLLDTEVGVVFTGYRQMILVPFEELGMSLVVGVGLAGVLSLLLRKISSQRDMLILVLGFVLVVNSIATAMHISTILTNMIIGLVIANTQRTDIKNHIEAPLEDIMPLLFIMFFVLAGTSLEVGKMASLTGVSIVYIIGRTVGLMGGAWFGATVGRADQVIRKYLGFGILSQAGVAIGLSLVASHELKGLGKSMGVINGVAMSNGDYITGMVLATVTVTTIFFAFFGPLFTKMALNKAGELTPLRRENLRLYRRMISVKHDSPLKDFFAEHAVRDVKIPVDE